jgi:hypothetical protein
MSCASSTTAKSKGGFLLLPITAAKARKMSEYVSSFRAFSPFRTRSNIDHNVARCAPQAI